MMFSEYKAILTNVRFRLFILKIINKNWTPCLHKFFDSKDIYNILRYVIARIYTTSYV